MHAFIERGRRDNRHDTYNEVSERPSPSYLDMRVGPANHLSTPLVSVVGGKSVRRTRRGQASLVYSFLCAAGIIHKYPRAKGKKTALLLATDTDRRPTHAFLSVVGKKTLHGRGVLERGHLPCTPLLHVVGRPSFLVVFP
ncbi:hypothetical protein MA16_Dca028937 [Dendrobium catenatum]|uniref:Uncharacterized protein n=1 Tax=Dendrobium catenatum TaxID=906689 RepID=A0A2I0VEF9_9ASPA|nr:hypothetical protein MA16_Dca028937 [Dendrobium catenatum]